jgi:hypothetical protein
MYVDALSDLEDFGDGAKPWADFIFQLENIQAEKSSAGLLTAIAFEMRAFHLDGDVGLGVSISNADWRAQESSDHTFYWGQITLHSVGALSDRLVRLYEIWWELPTLARPATQHLTAQAVGLNSNPASADSAKVCTKMFFESGAQKDDEEGDPSYAELYLNFDLANRRGWLREKDEGYRRQVVGWLTGLFVPGIGSVQ